MSDWRPMRLDPIVKPRIWGGTRLRDDWGKQFPTDEPYGESWEVTWRADDTNRVTGGPYDGRRLDQIAEEDRVGLIGTRLADSEPFPLLAKLLDCEQRLSVQVHPNQAYAQQHAGAEVKMEAWYVLDAPPDAEIIFGLRPDVTREDFAAAVQDGSLSETLQQRHIAKGDVVLVTPGTVHALLEGLVVYEIQQSSDTTYRVYDWDRVDATGTPRELHVAQALDCIAFGAATSAASSLPLALDDQHELLVATPAFALERITVDVPLTRRVDGTCCELVTIADGEGEIEGLGPVRRGDTVFVPAGAQQYVCAGSMTALVAYVPDWRAGIWGRARGVGHTDAAIRSVCGDFGPEAV